MRPAVILYDVTLVRSLPTPLVVSSGMNAIAHAVEGLYARDRNPISSLMALEGIRALASALPRLTGGAPDDDDWGEALYGAWLCGTVLGQVGMALHDKLCHALGVDSICLTPKPTRSSCSRGRLLYRAGDF